MPRRVEDILPNSRRSIRNVSMQHDEVRTRHESAHEVPMKRILVMPPTEIANRKRSHHKKVRSNSSKLTRIAIGIVGAIVMIGVIAYLASTYFSRAVFTIVPKTLSVSVDGNFVAASAPKDGLLLYTLIKAEDFASTTVPATDGPSLSAKAQGAINIFNAYSIGARKLIAGTRFMSDSGKIYKLSSTVIIPGYKQSADGNIVPGTIKANVMADNIGTKYNIDSSSAKNDLKIVAYRGGDKYDKIYGQVAGNISGGESGVKKVVNPTTMASTTAALQSSIKTKLLAKIRDKIPQNYFMFENSLISSFSVPEISEASPNHAVITIHGTIYGILFKKDELVAKLAKQPVADLFGGLPYDSKGLDKLSYTLSNRKDFSPEKENDLVMQLKGDLELAGKISVDELKKKFAGLSLADTKQILRSYAPIINLEKSDGQVVPPWSKIPNNIAKISIIVQ
jgi:hypothetical protein